MEIPKIINRTDLHPYVGWGALFGMVIAFDLINKRTLTEGFRNALEKPISATLALGATAVTASHLVNALPSKIDPFQLIGKTAEWLSHEKEN